MHLKVAVVILNWNGEKLLKQFLPSVIANSGDEDIYVIDNGSTDNSIEVLNQQFPQIKLIINEQNYGFAGGYNIGLKNIKTDIFVLLNSDVEVTPNWIKPIVTQFENDPKIGAAQPKIKDYKNKKLFEYAGAAGGFLDKYGYPYCDGRIFNSVEKDLGQYNKNKYTLWASGAAMFVRADLYRKLGGLDADFFAHMEEIDLCWRIKNAGYEVLYCYESEVYHVGGATLSKMNSHKTYLNFRNNLFLLIKNDFRTFWGFNFLIRMVLDGVASLRFLVLGEYKNISAVLKAHGNVYANFFKTLRKRKQFLTEILNGQKPKNQLTDLNMTLNYFLFKKRA